MGLDIDELSIKVEASSESAEKKLEKLISRLENLKKATTRLSGLDKLTQKLNKMAASINAITGIDKLQKMAESLNKLSQIKSPSVTKTVNSIKKLTEACNAVGSMSNIDTLKANITAITDACTPMENMGKNTFAPFLNNLKKIPDITKQLDTTRINEFAAMIRQLTAALEPLTTQVSKAENGLVALNNVIKSTTARNGNLAASNAATIKSYTSLSSVFKDARVRLAALYVTLYRVSDFLGDCLVSSNEYVENINLFTVAMGDYADEAYEYAQKVNSLLGIDVSEWIRFQGVFKQITTGFGVAAEKSNIMSKNLTQIGYDIASFFNISTEDAMEKVESGISGELEPLRRLGYALDAATLQQIAYDNGITQNINTMTQAQKSQLRYIAIMQQSTNAMGDMARTIITPANSIRILQQQIEQLKRAIGNIVSVFAVKLIPYVQVLIRLLTDAANAIADWLGFDLPTIDYSEVGKGLSSVTEEADDATEAVKETQKQLLALAGFDEINQLNLDKSSNDNGSDNAAGNKYDLGIDLPEYDFLAGLDKQTDKLYKQIKGKLKDLYNWLKKHRDIIKVIAGILATVWAVNKIKKMVDKVKLLYGGFKDLAIIKKCKEWLGNFTDGFKKSESKSFFGKLNDGAKSFRQSLNKVQKSLGIIVGTAVSAYGGYNLFKDLTTDTANWKSVLGDSAAIVGGLATSWLFGGGKGLAIAAIVTGVSALAGYLNGVRENANNALDRLLASEWHTAGTSITEIADGISSYCEALTGSEKIYNDACEGLKNIKGSAEPTNEALKNTLDTLSPDNWDEKAMSNVIDQFKNLADNTKEYSDTSIESLKTYVNSNSEFIEAVGGDVERINTILNNAKSNADEQITAIKDKINELTSKDNISDTEIQQLQELREQLADMMGIDVGVTASSLKDLKEEAKTLASQDINLENLDTMKTAVSNIGGNLTKSVKEIKEARENLFKQIDQLSVDEEDKKYLKETFGSMFKFKESELNDIQSDLKNGVLKKINDTIDQGLEDIANNHLEGFGAYVIDNVFGGSVAEGEIKEAQEKWLASIGISKNGASNFLKDAMLQGGLTVTDYEEIFNADAVSPAAKKSTKEITKNMSESSKEAKKCLEGLTEDMQKIVTDHLNSAIGSDDANNYIIGFSNALKSGSTVDEALKAAESFGKSELSSLDNSLGIHSPSRKTYQSGSYFTIGFTNGINAKKPEAMTTIEALANSAITTLDRNSAATSIGTKFADRFANGIKFRKNAVVNEVVDLFNAILEKTDEFHIQLLNSFNSVSPALAGGISALTSMQATQINYTAPGYRVQAYASGGFPETGQLFVARENGIPEMVGSIGNQNAVANNSQIEQALFKAVYAAMREASRDTQNSGKQTDNVNVRVSADESSFVKVAIDGINDITRRTGKSPIK